MKQRFEAWINATVREGRVATYRRFVRWCYALEYTLGGILGAALAGVAFLGWVVYQSWSTDVAWSVAMANTWASLNGWEIASAVSFGAFLLEFLLRPCRQVAAAWHAWDLWKLNQYDPEKENKIRSNGSVSVDERAKLALFPSETAMESWAELMRIRLKSQDLPSAGWSDKDLSNFWACWWMWWLTDGRHRRIQGDVLSKEWKRGMENAGVAVPVKSRERW